jgi:fumarate reductase flavoprotein subunit
VVFGKVAGEHAGEFAKTQQHGNTQALVAKAER